VPVTGTMETTVLGSLAPTLEASSPWEARSGHSTLRSELSRKQGNGVGDPKAWKHRFSATRMLTPSRRTKRRRSRNQHVGITRTFAVSAMAPAPRRSSSISSTSSKKRIGEVLSASKALSMPEAPRGASTQPVSPPQSVKYVPSLRSSPPVFAVAAPPFWAVAHARSAGSAAEDP